jgi:hypothetical protein
VVPLLVLGGLVAAAPAARAQHPGANGVITSVSEAVWSGSIVDGVERACCSPVGPQMIATEQAVWGPDGVSVAVVGQWIRDGGPAGLEILVYDAVADTVRSLGLADDSRPDFSPDGSQLVITRGGDLVVLDVATGAVVRTLTSTPAVAEVDPTWSADGSTIAFATPSGVSVVPAAGGACTPLRAGASGPQYSGDGKHLAYLVGQQLMLADADGAHEVDSTLTIYSYTWSPDSTSFVVSADLGLVSDTSEVVITTLSGHVVAAGPGAVSSSSFSWQPVPAPEPGVVVPLASVSGSTSSFSRSSLLRVRWTASDLVSTVVGTDVRYRRASALGGAYSTYRWWRSDTAARSAVLPATPGYRYCFSTRARNQAGAQSVWSAEKCATVPLDDRALAANGSWVRVSRDGFLRGTASRTTQKGASLTSAPGYVREVGIIASTGPNGGRVAVLVGSHRVGTISLVSATHKDRALLTLPRLHTGRFGAVRLVVISSGRTVRIDGLATSAW